MTWLLALITRNPLTIAAACFIFGAAVGAVPAWKYQAARLDAAKAEYKSFVDQTRVIGEQAQKAAQEKTKADQRNKEITDANHKRTTASLRADIERLQNSGSGSGGLSAPTPAAGSLDRTCFDSAKFDTALRNLGQEFLGIVETGSQAVIDLDSAKQWAQGRR